MAQEVQNGAEKTVSFSAFKPQLFISAPKASDAVHFYKTAFGAEEVGRTLHPKRKAEQDQPLILSADLKLGSALFSVSDLSDASLDPANLNAAACIFSLETESVEAAIAKAVAAGAVAEGEVAEGEGKVKDPYGFVWMLRAPAKAAEAEVEAAV